MLVSLHTPGVPQLDSHLARASNVCLPLGHLLVRFPQTSAPTPTPASVPKAILPLLARRQLPGRGNTPPLSRRRRPGAREYLRQLWAAELLFSWSRRRIWHLSALRACQTEAGNWKLSVVPRGVVKTCKNQRHRTTPHDIAACHTADTA